MELYNAGDSIECNKCDIVSRKIVPGALQSDDIIGDHMKYNCTQNSQAEITEECNPKKFRLKRSSNLNMGDRLKAETITVLTNKLKPVKIEVINQSHRHKSMRAVFNRYTFAEIKYPFEHILKALEKKKIRNS